MAKVTIREARKDDMLEVYLMKKAFALHNSKATGKPVDGMQIEHNILERDGFDTPSPAFKCLIAETPSSAAKPQTIGYAMYLSSYSAWIGKYIFLEDLFVKEEFRKCGAGKKLFLATAKIAEEVNCQMDFQVYGWNKPTIEFYKRLGSVSLTERDNLTMFRLKTEALKKSD